MKREPPAATEGVEPALFLPAQSVPSQINPGEVRHRIAVVQGHKLTAE